MSVRSLLGYPCPRIETFEKPDPVYKNILLFCFLFVWFNYVKCSWRFVKTLLNLMLVLRPYWKCLQGLNGDDASQKMTEYLAKWDEENRKAIKFFDLNNKPTSFPLTGFYPLYADEENARLDKIIDKLIESTDLFVPERKICCVNVTSEERASTSLVQFQSLEEVIESIAERKFTSSLALLGDKNSFLNAFQTVPSLALKSSERFKK